MLHMINECISGRASKTTFFQVSVLHIDESSALGLSHEEVRVNTWADGALATRKEQSSEGNCR